MVRHVLFIAAVVAQLAILAWSPLEKCLIRAEGTVIVLRTRPVDPYDVLSGYYMTLSFEISEPAGLEDAGVAKGETVFTTLARGDDDVWNAIGVSNALPDDLAEGQVAFKGRYMDIWRWSVIYGIERYYVPEAMRAEIEEAMRAEIEEAIRAQEQQILVEVAVDEDGDSSLLRLRVGDKVYEY